MDRLQVMEVFVAAADLGSFTKAAARMHLSPPAVTRAIAALETRLAAPVFHRTTRSLKLTEVGARFLENARRLLADVDLAERHAVGETAVPHGRLSITASVTYGRLMLAPVVCAFLERQTLVTASVVLLDRVVNLVEEGFDLAVRIGELPDSSLVARRIGTVRRVMVASPAYLERHGAPRLPADLKQHAGITFTGLSPIRDLSRTERRTTGSAPSSRLEINDTTAAVEAAERGEGITNALSYFVAERIRMGKLVLVLDQFAPPAVPVHIVYPASGAIVPKVRAFIDFAAPRLSEALDKVALPREAVV